MTTEVVIDKINGKNFFFHLHKCDAISLYFCCHYCYHVIIVTIIIIQTFTYTVLWDFKFFMRSVSLCWQVLS